MMTDVSDCGKLHSELWKLLDIDDLFAHVPLPDDVINVPELDDALPATHSVAESAKSLLCPSTIAERTITVDHQPFSVENVAMAVHFP